MSTVEILLGNLLKDYKSMASYNQTLYLSGKRMNNNTFDDKNTDAKNCNTLQRISMVARYFTFFMLSKYSMI